MDSGRLRAVFGQEVACGADHDCPYMRWRRFACGCEFGEKYSGEWRVRVKCPPWDALHETECLGRVSGVGEGVEWDD